MKLLTDCSSFTCLTDWSSFTCFKHIYLIRSRYIKFVKDRTIKREDNETAVVLLTKNKNADFVIVLMCWFSFVSMFLLINTHHQHHATSNHLIAYYYVCLHMWIAYKKVSSPSKCERLQGDVLGKKTFG